MAVYLSPIGNGFQFFGTNGLPLNGGFLNTYAAGTSTPLATYTTITGNIANAVSIQLNSDGRVPNEIWLTAGSSYKFILADSLGTLIPGGTYDNLTGINDPTANIQSTEWILSALTPTYISTTSFSVPGNVTNILTVNRRLQLSVSAGTVYGTIVTSAFAANVTTVTIDSAVLDNGLSTYSYGILNSVNSSFPILPDNAFKLSGSADVTKLLKWLLSGITTATTRTWTVQDKDITVAGLSDVNGGANLGSKIQPVTASVASNALTCTLNPTVLDFRSSTLGSGTVNTRIISAAISLTVASGATLGTSNGVISRLAFLAIDNAGTIESAIVNMAGGINLDETTLISTTALSVSSNSNNVIYSTTARTSVPFRVVGYIESTQATAGTWATAPSTLQGMGGTMPTILPKNSMVRVDTTSNYGSTNTVIRRFQNIRVNQGTDITYADSATLGGSFTINAPGMYSMNFFDNFTSASDLGVSLNSTQLTTGISGINASDRIAEASTSAAGTRASCGVTHFLKPGDVIRAHTNGVASSTADMGFTIARVS